MWTDGRCRGSFTCGGATVRCGKSGQPRQRLECSCASLRSAAADRRWLPHGWLPHEMPSALRQSLRAGVANRGNPYRLQRALRRVSSGQRLVVAGIGSSMTSDHGGVIGETQRRFPLGVHGLPARAHADEVVRGWLLPVLTLLARLAGGGNASIGADGAQAALVNCGLSGAPVTSVLDCTSSRVPDDADVILLDATSAAANGAALERLLRRLLALPHEPAVILIHLPFWCDVRQNDPRLRTSNFCRIRGERRRLRRSCADAARFDCATPGWMEASWEANGAREDAADALARHYRLPALSVRRAFFNASGRGVDGFRPSQLTYDGQHPVACEDRADFASCRYLMLISALINSWVDEAAASEPERRLARRSTTSSDGKLTDGSGANGSSCLPPPLWSAASEQGYVRSRCYGFAPPGWPVMEGRISQPLALGSWGWQFTDQDTAHHAAPSPGCAPRGTVASARSLCPKSKPGLTAFEGGSTALLLLELSTTLAVTPTTTTSGGDAMSARARDHVAGDATLRESPSLPLHNPLPPLSSGDGGHGELVVTYLCSWEAMGVATVSCERGCTCAPLTIDAHREGRRQSLWERAPLPLVLAAPRCLVRVVVHPNHTRSGYHKFKLGGLSVSWGARQESRPHGRGSARCWHS